MAGQRNSFPMYKKCIRFEHELAKSVKDMIVAAFSSSLPQMTQQESVNEYLITRQRLGLRRSTFVNSFGKQTTTPVPTTEWGYEDEEEDETDKNNTPPYGWGGGWTTTTSPPSTTRETTVSSTVETVDVEPQISTSQRETSTNQAITTGTSHEPTSVVITTTDFPVTSSTPLLTNTTKMIIGQRGQGHRSIGGRRKKRVPIALAIVGLVSGISALVAGSALGVGTWNRVSINALENQVKDLVEHSLLVGNKIRTVDAMMMGLNEIDFEMVHDADTSIKALHTVFKEQLRMVSRYIRQMKENSFMTHTAILHLIEQLELSDKTGRILNTIQRKIMEYEIAINHMKGGFLPSQLVPYSRLRNILSTIQTRLAHSNSPFSLGFSLTNEIESYYRLKLTTFTFVEQRLIIHISIPLKLKESSHPLLLFQPVYHPFPTPDYVGFESAAARVPFVKLSERTDFYVYKNGELTTVSDRNRMNCISIGEQHQCITFFSHPGNGRTRCIQAIYDGHWQVIPDMCLLDSANQQQYTPISLHNGSFVVHLDKALVYKSKCDDHAEEFIHLTTDITVISLGEGCTLTVNNNGVAPFHTIGGSYNFTYQLVGPPSKFTNIPEDKIILYPMHEIETNLTSMEAPIGINTGRMKEFASKLQQHVREFDVQSKEWEYKARQMIGEMTGETSRTGRQTLSRFVNLAYDVLMILFLCIALKRRLLVLVPPPIVRIYTNPVEGASVTDMAPDIPLMPSVNSEWISLGLALPIMKILLVFVVISFFYWRQKVVPIILSSHTGIPFNTDHKSRFYLCVAFVLQRRSWGGRRHQLITIYVPLKRPFSSTTVQAITLRQKYLYHYDHRMNMITITEPVKIRGLDGDGYYETSGVERVQFDLDNISWDDKDHPKPPNHDFYGDASILVTPDPSPCLP
jgi:hypothetical protein